MGDEADVQSATVVHAATSVGAMLNAMAIAAKMPTVSMKNMLYRPL